MKLPPRFRFRINLLNSLYLFAIGLNLLLRSLVPIKAAFLSPHDDQLGVELASNILSGGWLGEWNNRTLAKPPGYSLYLSIAHYIPIPLPMLNQLFYVLGVMILILKLKENVLMNFKFRDQFFLVSFTFLIFQPILFESESNRIYRSSVTSIVLTLSYSVILMGLLNKLLGIENFSSNRFKKERSIYLDFIILSLIYATMSLFRYESFWIVICSTPPLITAIIIRRHKFRLNHGEKKRFLRFLIPIPLLILVSYSTPVLIVKELNRSKFGVPLTENYFQGSFSEALNLWSSVDVDRDPRPYVLVSNGQRNAVYEVSRNARLMKSFLESPTNGWNKAACDTLKLCDNSGASFTWQVRDASVSTGLVYSERTFQSFFNEIASDIQKACDTSTFGCTKKSNLTGSKPLMEIPLHRLLDFTFSNFNVLIPLKLNSLQFPAKPDTYGAPEEVVKNYHQVVRYKFASDYDDKQIASVSKILVNIDKFYSVLNFLFLVLGVIGIMIGFIRYFNPNLMLIALFLVGGVLSQLVGASLAQISFGYPPGSTQYLLSAYPMVQMFCLIGSISLLSQFPKKERVIQ